MSRPSRRAVLRATVGALAALAHADERARARLALVELLLLALPVRVLRLVAQPRLLRAQSLHLLRLGLAARAPVARALHLLHQRLALLRELLARGRGGAPPLLDLLRDIALPHGGRG